MFIDFYLFFSKQSGFGDFFSLRDKPGKSDGVYSANRDRDPQDRNRYQDRDRYSQDRDRYSQDRDRYSQDRYSQGDRHQQDRYSNDKDRYSDKKDRYFNDKDRYSNDNDKYLNDKDRYSNNRDRYSENRYSEDRDRYSVTGERYYHTKNRSQLDKHEDGDWKRPDRYATDRLGLAGDNHENDSHQYRTPLYPDNAWDQEVSDRRKEEEVVRKGTMFFHRRQIPESNTDTGSHVSYGK